MRNVAQAGAPVRFQQKRAGKNAVVTMTESKSIARRPTA